MKRIINILLILITLFIGNECLAKSNSIVLNKPVTDDINHTFKYPNLTIKNDIKPYSITLSIDNGYFNASDVDLNGEVLLYYNFIGGTDTTNAYIDNLNTSSNYKIISFNLKNSIDLSDSAVKTNVITSIKNFLKNIVFINNTDMDSTFNLSFSEVALKLSSSSHGLSNIDLIAFKGPDHDKEHYYARINSAGIEWTEAYDFAADLKFNNLQGYLVTITSEQEHNFIYQSLGSIRAWMGAAAITNYDTVDYNTKNIVWNDAMTDLKTGDYETNKKEYWRWVAGPEAGNQVFSTGSYTNFSSGEPNNYGTGEWCGEYGHGEGGVWNDYPTYVSDIGGFYIEFGGFPDDDESIKPTTLVNTFKWNDYDYRNIKNRVNKKINEIPNKEVIDEETLINIVEEAITESGLSNITYTVDFENKKISLDISTDLYNFSVLKNPNTSDNIYISFILLIISIIGIAYSMKYELEKL